jgi:hypothetical protein
VNVENKRQAFALFHSGRLGNKFRTWDSVRDFVYSRYSGLATMRYKGTVMGKAWVAYNVPHDQVAAKAKEWIAEGADPMMIVVNESAPDERLTIQGELILTIKGLAFFYSTLKMKMRMAMTEGKQVYGMEATALLRRYCSPASYDDLMELFERFPDSAIEFSVYEMYVGCFPRRNTVIWEVRNY